MVNGHVIISEGLQMGGVIVVDLCSVGSVLWPSTCKPIPFLFSLSLDLHLPLVPLSLSPLVPLSLLHFFDLSPSLLPLQYKQPPSLFHSLMMPSQLRENRKRVLFRFELEVLEDLTQSAVCLQIIAALTDDPPKPSSISFLLQQQESWSHSKQSCSTGQHRHVG